jgi:uncharacterized membrane protein YqgA involved in biofilm formation
MQSSAIIFVASSLAMVAITRSTIRKNIDTLYSSTLMDMFKATKLPSRHAVEVSKTTDVFTERTNFFKQALKNSTLSLSKL